MEAKIEKKLLKLVMECIRDHGSMEYLYYQSTEGLDVSESPQETLQKTVELMDRYEDLGNSLAKILSILKDDLAKKAR